MLADSRLNVSQQCALAAKMASHILGCIKHSIGTGQEVILLLDLVFRWPQLEYRVQFWATQYEKDVETLESIQRSATKLVTGLEGLSCEERLRTPGLPSLEMRLRGGLTASS